MIKRANRKAKARVKIWILEFLIRYIAKHYKTIPATAHKNGIVMQFEDAYVNEKYEWALDALAKEKAIIYT